MSLYHDFKSEEQLAALVVDWLRDQKWEVYQEVQPRRSSNCADIVATQGPLLWVIECKLSFSMGVIEQAHDWKGMAHLVSVAVPRTRGSMAEIVCRHFGIGVLRLCRPGSKRSILLEVEPEFDRKAQVQHFRESLTEHHKTYARAGNSAGERWSPFKDTCHRVAQAVKERPGATLKEIIDGVGATHYSSQKVARACMARWIEGGIVEGVRIERKDGKLLLYPNELRGEEKGSKRGEVRA